MNKRILSFVLSFASLGACVELSAQKFDQIARTPPMGWNSWNKFNCDINENIIREIADAMASNGMKEAGYEYVVIDDCWHGERDSLGFIQPNPKTFPSGMKALADYVHSKGLKFGIYSSIGEKTCQGRSGSGGREYQDAIQYAKWGVDYLKYDGCSPANCHPEGAIRTISNALKEAGRPVVLSVSPFGEPWTWAEKTVHMWRMSSDIMNCFDCQKGYGSWFKLGVLQILDETPKYRRYVKPGFWMDVEMLQVGNGLTESQNRAHFSIWAILAAPLMAGNDLREMDEPTLKILTEKEVISIDQDPAGIPGFRYMKVKDLETWVRPLAKGEWAICFLNRGLTSQKHEIDWDEMFNAKIGMKKGTYSVRNIWEKNNIGTTKNKLTVNVQGEDVVLLRIKPVG
ncbi:glycoside hydrolase family 27 protein [Proteiniphilum sp. X52]|uniref:glycoside hydrolase family 27 protein n=1 Tax=Proteiniphilum sp. X52 TaxID=2382159 RepID=UPI000F09AA53|nr:glycoside hydrolase family 27 protein [Proteiniphilum sp. X52]RNC65642.1 glycoside hydrolase family 27 protein [Proteiniphilum sp. X52]